TSCRATLGTEVPRQSTRRRRLAIRANRWPWISQSRQCDGHAISLLRGFPNEPVHVSFPRRYLLISPCRDEAKYLRRTLDSVAAQSVVPSLWVVVDDGSTDDTAAILNEYARQLPYLHVVRRPDRGRRQVGPGVIDAFYAGMETVRLEDFDYL